MRTKIAPLQSDGGAGLQQSIQLSCRYRAGLSARHSAQGTLNSHIYIFTDNLSVCTLPPW